MKAYTTLFLKIQQSKFDFFSPRQINNTSSTNFDVLSIVNTVLSCNINHRRYFPLIVFMLPIMISQWTFPVFSCLRDCRSYYIFLWGSQMTYQVCDWNFHLKREYKAFLYRVLYLQAECLTSAEFRPSNNLFLESLISLISPLDFRIILHPVNLDIYIDYLVLYSWGAVDFNPLLLFSYFLSIFHV